MGSIPNMTCFGSKSQIFGEGGRVRNIASSKARSEKSRGSIEILCYVSARMHRASFRARGQRLLTLQLLVK